ncbi:hypothetical protein MBLNU230_g7648t1 [Neophaeotheca triangularis]
MAAAQKRMLSAPKGKIAKMDPSDLITALQSPEAWDSLSEEQKRHLYSLLSVVGKHGEPLPLDQIDLSINPLDSKLKDSIERGIKRFHRDLSEGRREKKWVDDAVKASQERSEGKFDAFLLVEKEDYWGKDGKAPEKEGEGVDDDE